MFYMIKVNTAIALLGAYTTSFSSEYRVSMQTIGKSSGNTPQETAIFMVSQLSPADLPLDFGSTAYGTVSTWFLKGKIRQFAIKAFRKDTTFNYSYMDTIIQQVENEINSTVS